MNDAIERMSAAAFDNYDPSGFDGETYDPTAENFDEFGRLPSVPANVVIGQKMRRPKPKQATFNISIDGSANAAAHIFELFNNEFSITKYANGNTNPGLLPLLAARRSDVRNSAGTGVAQLYSYGAILANPVGTGVGDGVYWTDNGDLLYNYNVGTNDNILISCQEVPYRALFEYTASGSMRISKMRIQYSQSGQIYNDFTYTYRNILGTKKESSISPKQFFTPNQFQSLLIDCPTPFIITKERGLQMTLQAATKINITFFVDAYTQPNA